MTVIRDFEDDCGGIEDDFLCCGSYESNERQKYMQDEDLGLITKAENQVKFYKVSTKRERVFDQFK